MNGDVSRSEQINNMHRNLQEVFGEGDAAQRRAAIEPLYTEDRVLHVAPGTFVSRDALDRFAGDLRATHPHFAYTPKGEPHVLHDAWHSRVGLGLGRRGTGIFRHRLIVMRGDRIGALYVFLNPKFS